MSDARTRAIGLIHSLKLLAEHPNTPAPEAEAARGRIAFLRTKHGIGTGDPVQDALKRERERTQAARDAWTRHAEEAKRAEEAMARAANDRRASQDRSPWDIESTYEATIIGASQEYSLNRNPMVTLTYLVSVKGALYEFRSWHTTNTELGVKSLMEIGVTLLGAECVDWPIHKLLAKLRSNACKVKLGTWERAGRTAWKVDQVLRPW